MHDDLRAGDAFAVAPGALPQAAGGAGALANPATAWAVMPHADSVSAGGGAASSSSPTCAAITIAGYRNGRYGEAIQQAAQLANWEDEGGTTSS